MVIAADQLPHGRGEALSLVRELFKDASQEHRKRVTGWNRNYRLLRNRMWSDFRASWLPSPSSSEIFPTVHTLVSYLSSQAPRTYLSPAPDLSVKPDPELLAGKTRNMQATLDSWWITAACQRTLRMGLWDTFSYGCGILKTGYDLSASDGEGTPTLIRADPYSILPDPQASGVDDLRYLIEARDAPVFEVRRRFPHADPYPAPDASWPVERRPDPSSIDVVPMANLGATGVTGAFPGTPTQGIPPRFGPPGRTLYRSEDYTQTVRLIECWIRESDTVTVPVILDGERQDDLTIDVPTWRLIVVAGEEVIHDDDNPFSHHRLPYVRLPMVEIGEWWSMSLIDHLAPAQIAINRLLAALQQNAEITGNPILIDYSQSGTSRTKFQARPGARTTVQDPRFKPEWMNPPDMPSVYYQLIDNYRQSIDRISGISDVARGQSLRRREPAQAVDSAQEASFTRIGDVLRNVEDSLREALVQVASNIGQYFIEPRSIPLVGPDGTSEYLDLPPKPFYYPVADGDTIEDEQVRFDLAIEAGSSLPISHQAKVAEVLSWFFAGVVDFQYVLETIKPPGWNAVLERMKAQPAPAPEGANPRKDR